MRKNKLIIIFLFISILIDFNLKAQNLDENMGQLYFGVAGGVGIVNPTQINDDIATYYGDDVGVHLALNVELNLGYFVTNKIEVKGALIAASAISIVEYRDIVYMKHYETNLLTRLAPEIIVNYHFYSKQNSLYYAGGGFSYNKLDLYIDSEGKSGSGTVPGFVVNIGTLLSNRKNQTFLEVKANIINDKYDYMNFSGITLNYRIRF